MIHAMLPYSISLSLLTDLYELTMAYGYWKSGRHEQVAVFHHFFRHNPFDGGYTIAAGLGPAVELLEALRFDGEDIGYLRTLKGGDGQPLFEPAFLEYLSGFEFTCDVDAMPEGTVVFPHEPLVRVQGPILQAQFVETMLLNIINFQSLIATKAARVCSAAGDEPVIEFGLRRAQGIDGGLSASRAAFIGGCAGTSNTLAGRIYGIPVKGTHAHSWTMSYDSEREAFEAYAEAMPNNCIFLVDTYDSISGVRNAIRVGLMLREKGHEMVGIRLDSGDLAYLSVEARRMLDEAGFEKAAIVASNELDEWLVTSLHQQGARINIWGVGTKLVTGEGQPALGGVYKLTAIRSGNQWRRKLKLSEQVAKVNTPGILNVRRFFDSQGRAAGDAIFDVEIHEEGDWEILDPIVPLHRKELARGLHHEDLLVPVFRKGKAVYDMPALAEIQARTRRQLACFHPGIRRFENPHVYPVGLERQLHNLRMQLMEEERGKVFPPQREGNQGDSGEP